MTDADARAAVIEFLVASGGESSADHGTGNAPDGGPVARVSQDKGFAAHPETIEILKQRCNQDRCLFAAGFIDDPGNRWEYLVAVEHDGTRWRAHGVAGGSDGPPSRRPRRRAAGPLKLEVFGQWGGDVFYAAGRLTGRDQGVAASACLTLANGDQITDDLAGGVALFIGRAGSAPVMTEIFDQDGRSLARQRNL